MDKVTGRAKEATGSLTGDGFEAKLDRIAKDVHSLADREIPALKKEVAELREMLANSRQKQAH